MKPELLRCSQTRPRSDTYPTRSVTRRAKSFVLLEAIFILTVWPCTVRAWVCYPDGDGDCASWSGGAVSYRVNLTGVEGFQTHFGSDTELSGVNYLAHVNFAVQAWAATEAGSALSPTYSGTTTNNCNLSANDGVNTVGASSTMGNALGFMRPRFDNANDRFVEADVCVNAIYSWTMREDGPANRYDMRYTLLHELGHMFGLHHTASTIMGPTQTAGALENELWGDDEHGAQAVNGFRVSTIYARNYSAVTHTWGSSWSLNWYTSLPVGAAVGFDAAGASWTIQAPVIVQRTGVYFRRTPYAPSASSTWTNRLHYLPSNHAIAITGSNDQRWLAAWPDPVATWQCGNGLRIYRTANLFDTATTYWHSDICTSHEVGLTFDSSTGRFVLAYVANRTAGGGRIPHHVYIRTSTSGTLFSAATEVDVGINADAGVSVACRQSGVCGLATVTGGNNRYETQVPFTINPANGQAVLGSALTRGNWVYEAPQVFSLVADTFLFLDFTNLNTGVHSHWYMRDASTPADFPVHPGSYSSLSQTSVLRSSVAAPPWSGLATLFYIP